MALNIFFSEYSQEIPRHGFVLKKISTEGSHACERNPNDTNGNKKLS